MIGPFVNGAAVIAGSAVGAMLGPKLDKHLRASLPLIFGIVSMGIGITMIVKVHVLAPVILALILGTAIGELTRFEHSIQKGANRLRGVVERVTRPTANLSKEEFLDKYVAIAVLFCVSGVGVVGSLHEGMTGDPSLLFIKAILDFCTGMIFASMLGYSVCLLSVPQFIIQSLLFVLAVLIVPLTNAGLIGDFSCCGGLIMLATGFRICSIKMFPVANMIPALIIVMPLSALWSIALG